MEDLARNAGWYLSVAVFGILAMGIGGWFITSTLRFFFGKPDKAPTAAHGARK
jgi:hypothetical protein